MRVIFWLARGLFIILMVRMVLHFIASLRRPPAARPRAPRGTNGLAREGGVLVRDPQCGTYVAQSRAVSLGRGDDISYFCSTTCRDEWLAAQQGPARARSGAAGRG